MKPKNFLIKFTKDNNAMAVVEATILFPIIIMTFIAFILLAVYLPTSVAVGRSAAKAAVIVSASQSDLGYTYNTADNTAGIDFDRIRSENVYVKMFTSDFDRSEELGMDILEKYVNEAFFAGTGTQLTVRIDPHDKRFFVLVQAEQTMKMPFNFPILPFSNEFTVKATRRAMIRDTDEFIRNMDIVYDLTIKKSQKVNKTLGNMSSFWDNFNVVKRWIE